MDLYLSEYFEFCLHFTNILNFASINKIVVKIHICTPIHKPSVYKLYYCVLIYLFQRVLRNVLQTDNPDRTRH